MDASWADLVFGTAWLQQWARINTLNTVLFCFHWPELIFHICMQEPLLGLRLLKNPNERIEKITVTISSQAYSESLYNIN